MNKTTCECGGRKAAHARRCRSCHYASLFHPREGITDGEIAWVAGILEGEGCFTSNGKYWWIAVHMTDIDVIEKLKTVTGLGKTSIAFRCPTHKKQAYRWVVASKLEKAWLCERVLPWMHSRRTARIRELQATRL